MSDIPPVEPMSQPAAGLPEQAPPPMAALPIPLRPAVRRRSRAGIWILAILLALSVLINLVLLAALSLSRLDLDMTTGAGRPLQKTTVEYAATKDTVAVIHVDGLITDAPLRGWGASGTDCALVKQQVDQALGDGHVKAVVLKVDSPGGSASASDMMLHELKRLSESKPVVAHMGSVAASGGYYVSMAADKIIAQPTCITGSIGVMGQVFNFQDLMGDKLGIKVYTFKSGDYKDVGNPFRGMTDQEKSYLQDTLIAPMYERFLNVVAEGRPKMKPDRIRELADGRVYTAQQAVDNGLVDDIGFFEDAIAEAKKLANLTDARVIEYRRQTGLFDLLSMSAKAKSAPLIELSPDTVNAWSTPRIMMLWQGQ